MSGPRDHAISELVRMREYFEGMGAEDRRWMANVTHDFGLSLMESVETGKPLTEIDEMAHKNATDSAQAFLEIKTGQRSGESPAPEARLMANHHEAAFLDLLRSSHQGTIEMLAAMLGRLSQAALKRAYDREGGCG